MTPAQEGILDELLAVENPALRRRFDPGLAAGLRAEIERGLAPWAEMVAPGTSSVVSKYPLHQAHSCEGLWAAGERRPFAWTVSMVKGRVAHEAIQLSIVSPEVGAPLELIEGAVNALMDRDRQAGPFLKSLPAPEIARLKGEANDAVVKFLSDWPPISPAWFPRVESPVRVDLCDGRILLSGKLDFALGRPRGTEGRVVIIDFKTGGAYAQHAEELRFYALLETLRSGVPPFRVAAYYLDAGTFSVEDVTEDTLASAVRRTVDGARKIIELRAGRRTPDLTPGGWCRGCPARGECDPGMKYLSSTEATAGYGG